MKVSAIPSNFKNFAELNRAFLAKLATSALTTKDAARLRLRPYTATDVARRFASLPVARAGFSLPYFDLSGRTTDFYRFRYLEFHNGTGFAALTNGAAKPLRYAQEPGSLNQLYLPPFVPWKKIASDPTITVLITEGELKAGCATKMGLPTIGLGGVWNFKTARAGMHLLPMFAEFEWMGRAAYICYDSDAASNTEVAKAENALARELLTLGARPFVVRLPALEKDKKTGLDDYLVARGAEEFREKALGKASEFSLAIALHELNEQVLYVRDPGLIFVLANSQRITPRAFVDHAFSTCVYYEAVGGGATPKTVERSAPKEWLKWPMRTTVPQITYAPGEPETTVDGARNVWPGWGCASKKGTVVPWTELMEYIFTDAGKESRRWFEQWLAYPVQHPGEKLYSAVLMWGVQQGTGKSLVGYTMFRIYGRNATEISDKDLYASHNEWAENRQFVMGDEITSGERKRDAADRMKSIITQKQLRLNPKYIPAYTVPDCINYYFTSNHPDAFFLEERDRRFFILELNREPAPAEFYARFLRWRDKEAGAEALRYYLENLDLEGFLPTGPAPLTASKLDMIEAGRSDIANWVAALKTDPDRTLVVAGKPLPWALWTTAELFSLYDPDDRKRVTKNGLSRELKRAGFAKLRQIVTRTAGTQRLWVLRGDPEELQYKKPAYIADRYDRERGFKKMGEIKW